MDHALEAAEVEPPELFPGQDSGDRDCAPPPPPPPVPGSRDHWEAKRVQWEGLRAQRARATERRWKGRREQRAREQARIAAELAEVEREREARIASGDADPEIDPSTLTREQLRSAIGVEPQDVPPDRVGPAPKPSKRRPKQYDKNRRQRRISAAAIARQVERNDQRSAEQERRDKRERQHVARMREKFKRKYGEAGLAVPKPANARESADAERPIITRAIYEMGRLCLEDDTGRTMKWYLKQEQNKLFVGAVRNGARAPLPDGSTRYDWRDRRARVIAVLGLAVKGLGRMTKREGPHKGLTRGVNRCGLLLIVADPNGGDPFCDECKHTHPSYAALTGIHRKGGTIENGQVGWIVALQQSGALYRQQFKHPDTIAKCCQPWELGEEGYPCNWYWWLASVTHPNELTGAETLLHAALREQGDLIYADDAPRRISYARRRTTPAQAWLMGPLALPP